MTAPASRTGAHAAETRRQGRTRHRRGAGPGPRVRGTARPGGRGTSCCSTGCEQDPVVSYDMGTEKGLAQTAELVRDAGRRAIARQADVRDRMPSPPPRPTGTAGWMSSWQRGNLHVAAMDAVTFEVWNATLVHLPAITGGCYRLLAGGRSDFPALPGGGLGRAGAAGTPGAAVMGAAPRVTSRRGHAWQVRPGAAVRDRRPRGWPGGTAARAGGDVGRREQVAVAREPAVRAAGSRPGGLGTRPGTAGQVDDVPRSSTMTVIPAASALSRSALTSGARSASPAGACCAAAPLLSARTPRGSPTASVPTRW